MTGAPLMVLTPLPWQASSKLKASSGRSLSRNLIQYPDVVFMQVSLGG
jgi:hypothetical protein